MKKLTKGIIIGSVLTIVGGAIIASKCLKKDSEKEEDENIGVIKYNNDEE